MSTGGSQCPQNQSWSGPQGVIVSHGGGGTHVPRACPTVLKVCPSIPRGAPGVFVGAQVTQEGSWCLQGRSQSSQRPLSVTNRDPGVHKKGYSVPRVSPSITRGSSSVPRVVSVSREGIPVSPSGSVRPTRGSQCLQYLLVRVPAPEGSSPLPGAQRVDDGAVPSARVLLLPHPWWATPRRSVTRHRNRAPEGTPRAPLGTAFTPVGKLRHGGQGGGSC